MINKFQSLLNENEFYKIRSNTSKQKISRLQAEMDNSFKEFDIAIFVVGSIGRNEVGEKSDLDLFIVSKKDITRLEQYEIFSKLIDINKKLNFPKFSNDGQFLKIHKLDNLKIFTGSPKDDSLNLFTTRMLMILESQVLFNRKLYNEIMHDIIEHYLRDRKQTNDSFKPLFLLNDILRFWRTLCLNYELIRHNEDKPWRKKNINLKYSRMLTVYSTVLAIIIKKDIDCNDILNICNKTPIERISWSLDTISDESLLDDFKDLLSYYRVFLEAKEKEDIENDIIIKDTLNTNADKFSDIIFNILNHKNIDNTLKKYLVI